MVEERDNVHQAVRASIIKLLVHIHYLFPIHFSLREGVRISFSVSDTRLVEVGGTGETSIALDPIESTKGKVAPSYSDSVVIQ